MVLPYTLMIKEELLMGNIQKWQKSIEEKGFRINVCTTKVMKFAARPGLQAWIGGKLM